MKEILISNIPFTWVDLDLKRLFEKFGEIKNVRILRRREGASKGLAFLEFEEDVYVF